MKKLKNLRRKVLVRFAFLGLVITGLIACQPDVNQFITKESFDEAVKACENSTDIQCPYRPSLTKVEKYCSENNLSDTQCKRIMDDVFHKALYFRDQQTKEIQQTTEKLQRVTEELKRKNGLK